MTNIEKSGFRPGEYVGWDTGGNRWKIVKRGKIWAASKQTGGTDFIRAEKLSQISMLLSEPHYRKNPTRRRKRCWPGYRPVPGKKAYSKGSCARANPSKAAMWNYAPVIFRTDKKNGEVMAVFPYESGTNDPSTLMIYVHNGQHGSADIGYVNQKTRPSTAEEIKPLLNELRQIGYDNLKILRRSPGDAGRVRMEKLLPRQNPTKSRKWKVWNYDVWGNEQDGWDVNDRISIGKIELSDFEENDETAFNKAMVREDMNVRWKDIDTSISSEDVIYFRRERDGMPLGELTRE